VPWFFLNESRSKRTSGIIAQSRHWKEEEEEEDVGVRNEAATDSLCLDEAGKKSFPERGIDHRRDALYAIN